MTTFVHANLLFCHHRLLLSSLFAVDGMERKQGRRQRSGGENVNEMCQNEKHTFGACKPCRNDFCRPWNFACRLETGFLEIRELMRWRGRQKFAYSVRKNNDLDRMLRAPHAPQSSQALQALHAPHAPQAPHVHFWHICVDVPNETTTWNVLWRTLAHNGS